MDRVKHSTAVAALPAFVDNGATPGYFQDENLSLGQEGTVVPAWWLNQIQEELRAVIVAGGGTPSPSTLNQVLTAINALISTATPDASTTVKGIVQLLDAIDNTSTTLAATANAARMAYDRGSLGITNAAAAQSTADAAAAAATALDGRVDSLEAIGSSSDNITLPGGAIIKSGMAVTDGSGVATVTFGAAFPTAVTSITATVHNATNGKGATVTAISTTGATLEGYFHDGTALAFANIYWMAIGH